MYMTDEEDKPSGKPPRKTTRKNVRKTTNKTSKKTDKGEKNTDEMSDDFKNKIKEALQRNLDEYAKERNLSQKQISVLNSFVEEHLSCFIILGYTVDGNPVTLVNANTPKDSDSLGTLIQKFLAKYTNEPPTMGMF